MITSGKQNLVTVELRGGGASPDVG